MEKSLNLKHSYTRNVILFIIGSIIGIYIFFIPNSEGRLPFEIMYKSLLLNPLGDNVVYVILAIVSFKFLGYIYAKIIAKKDSWMYKHFENDSTKSFILYFLAFTFAFMVYFQKGIPFIYSDKTAGMMMKEVLPFTVSILPIGGAVLPFLTAYGLLEFVGCLLEPIMRPALKLPGKAAVDTVASIVGAAVVGIYLTSTLYHENEYTDREALSIASGFSLNSVGYCAFLVGYVGLSYMFGPMVITYFIVAYTIGAIVVRIPPISKHKDLYKNGNIQTDEMRKENAKLNKAQVIKGYKNAILKADSSGNVFMNIVKGFIDGVGVLISIVPTMIVIAGIALTIYEYTPVIDIVSLPLVPIVKLLGVPEPYLAAKAVFTGGIELFVPSMLVTAGTTIEATRYFVVMVTMVQVLYITETMLPIINFGIPVKLWELFVIWVQRTLIAMPLVAIAMHLIF